jgi:hypothetical protein
MKYATTIAALLFAALLLAAPGAVASPAQRASEHAASMAVAANAQQATEHAAALRPDVAAAVHAGEGPALLSSHDPDLLAALLPYASQQDNVTGRAPIVRPPAGAKIASRHGPRAHAAGCWGWIADQQTFTVFGGTIAWIYVRNNGWCGNGYAITWYGGPTYAAWSWGPYCWGSKGSDYSWDYWPSWIHTAHWGELGVSYPWGCAGIRGGKAQVRFAANGYWDRFNDYGF